MCLALPGKIESIVDPSEFMTVGIVSFGGIRKEINLSMVPEASVGDYVLVHVGVAISKIDEKAAAQTLDDLNIAADSGLM